jgi:hypothetical protein
MKSYTLSYIILIVIIVMIVIAGLSRRSQLTLMPRSIVVRTSKSDQPVVCSYVSFTETINFTFSTFRAYLLAAQPDMSPVFGHVEGLIRLDPSHKLVIDVANGVNVTVDMQKSQRFMKINGGEFVLRGFSGGSLVAKNGIGFHDPGTSATNGGGINVSAGGKLTLESGSLVMNACTAWYAAGFYLVNGTVNINDNVIGHRGRLIARWCSAAGTVATSNAGGGFNFYEGTVNINSENGGILAENCRSNHFGGGVATFGANINLFGRNCTIETRQCHAGSDNDRKCHSGGFVFIAFEGFLGKISFYGENSQIIAEDCTAAAHSGMSFQNHDVPGGKGLYFRDSNTHLVVSGNEIVRYAGNRDTNSRCAVYLFYVTTWTIGGNTPNTSTLYITADNNTCYDTTENCVELGGVMGTGAPVVVNGERWQW